MAFLTIDENKCKQDGICAAECPRRIITQEDDASYPQVAEADEAYCMVCGHCVAVCPHGALSVTGVDIEDCPEIEKNLVLSWDQTEQFLRSQRERQRLGGLEHRLGLPGTGCPAPGRGNLLGRAAPGGHAGHPRVGGTHGTARGTHLVLPDDDRVSQV